MRKYLSVFKISLAQEFAYRTNFIMWRVRNVIQIFLIFFLWDSVFTNSQTTVFGYNKAKILTYVFGLIIVRAFVLSARAVDVPGEVQSGSMSNLMLKPINYFKYWLTRDLSSKTLNLGFAAVEAVLLFFLLKPPFYLQTNPGVLFAFVISISLAMLIYFIVLFISSAVPLWVPEAGWGSQFLINSIFVEFLSGAIFPLDVLPKSFQAILNLTPFPYMIFFPLEVYLGKLEAAVVLRGIFISTIWLIVLWLGMNALWRKGLKAYQSQGR